MRPSHDDATWFKKDRKKHRDEKILHLQLAPGHRETRPDEQPLELFYDKLKRSHMLRKFDHKPIQARNRSIEPQFRTVDGRPAAQERSHTMIKRPFTKRRDTFK